MAGKHSITFVSAYFTLKETPYFTKGHPDVWNPDLLMDIVSLGVPVCLYVDKDNVRASFFQEWERNYPNFRVMPYRVDYKDTWIHLKCTEMLEKGCPIGLPAKRNHEKDTYEYLVYLNSRVELMEDAISENIWETDHFAWIDFNLSHLFRNKDQTLEYLRTLSLQPLSPRFLVLPGCWPKPANLDTISTDISWRFCGGFFLGDADTIAVFGDVYRTHFGGFLERYETLPWEVNFWAYIEHAHGWTPTWYKGDHTDAIVHVSADAYTLELSIETRQEYAYPAITKSSGDEVEGIRGKSRECSSSKFAGFYPSSASYLCHRGKHYLNTRYVSYWMYPNGYYRFRNGDHVIENKNVVSVLDPASMAPVDYREMGKLYGKDGGELAPVPHPENKRHFTEGLEDIRLYSLGDSIRFLATTVNYSPNGRPRMMVGTYCPDTLEYRDCQVVQPPTDTWCEKNWIPLPKYDTETGVSKFSGETTAGRRVGKWEEWFVYKWCPMEIGRVDSDTNTLHILQTWEMPKEIFSKIRGSTPFVEYGDGRHFVGLVHSSEEHTPRHYYHMLVLLEKDTFRPVKWSRTFYFEKLSIEFCVGMAVMDGMYRFWISRFDRDPVCLTTRMDSLPFL